MEIVPERGDHSLVRIFQLAPVLFWNEERDSRLPCLVDDLIKRATREHIGNPRIALAERILRPHVVIVAPISFDVQGTRGATPHSGCELRRGARC